MEKDKLRNNLKNETSPYLLQHANNPVDWYAWNKESIELAKKLDKPIFLSIGYSTCHWCHVMAHESFENEETAKVMNELFVNIKVDKEERPDIDKVYMQYLHATRQGSGWPLSVWLTPDLNPIVGGTYFPPVAKYGRPGFAEVCKMIANAWKTEKNEIKIDSKNTIEKMKKMFLTKRKVNEEISFDKIKLDLLIDNLSDYFLKSFDSIEGGFGDAPKFPRVSLFESIFQLYQFSKSHPLDHIDSLLNMAFFTLRKMALGGMNDQLSTTSISGSHGFHRYSVDKYYHVPHYEKMIYDQAQLISAYTTAHKICLELGHLQFANHFRDVVFGVLNYLSSDLFNHSFSVFYTAEDADSLPSLLSTKPSEGAYYVWEYDEVKKILDNEVDFNLFVDFYGLKPSGNSPPGSDPHHELINKNTLKQFMSIEELAEKNKQSIEFVEKSLKNSKQKLFDVRSNRPKPFKDTKILCYLNAMVSCSLVHASNIFQLPQYLDQALKIFHFIKQNFYNEESKILYRNYSENKEQRIEGFSDDYAWTIKLSLDLYERFGNFEYLQFAEHLQQRHLQLFYDHDNNGGFFENSGNDESVLMRVKEEYDGAEPSSTSLSLFNLSRLSKICKDPSFKDKVESSFVLLGETLENYPHALPYMVKSLLHYSDKQSEIVIVGDHNSKEAISALEVIHSLKWSDNKIIIFADGKDGQKFLSNNNQLLQFVEPSHEFVRVMICEGFTCKMPLDSTKDIGWNELKKQLSENY